VTVFERANQVIAESMREQMAHNLVSSTLIAQALADAGLLAADRSEETEP
jgi:hypothetical protein